MSLSSLSLQNVCVMRNWAGLCQHGLQPLLSFSAHNLCTANWSHNKHLYFLVAGSQIRLCVLTSVFNVRCCHHDTCIWFTARPSANFDAAAISKGHWGCCWGRRGSHGKLHTWHRGSPHGLYGGPLYHRPWCCCGVGAGREHTHTPGDTLLIV